MSLVLSIRFLTGKFHATPWNHQVNEGVVEYPPSPWRLLRALVSAYYHLPESPPRSQMNELVTVLAGTLPAYRVPPHTTAHTRHYMPTFKESKSTSTKVLDTFVVFGRAKTDAEDAQIKAVWEGVKLDEKLLELLELLCDNVTYLGRAESWCELSVSQSDDSPIDCNVKPLDGREVTTDETVRLLAPLSGEGLVGFQQAIAAVPKPPRSKWQVPRDVLEALEVDVGDLHSQGWSGVPGARWVAYTLPKTFPESRLASPSDDRLFTVARFDFRGKVLPPLTEALAVGERFRQALICRSNKSLGQPSETFSGRDGEEKKLGQNHAWYLPEDGDGDGRLDRLWIFARGGFTNEEVKVLLELNRVWGGRAFEMQTLLTGLGRLEDYRRVESPPPDCPPSIMGCSNVWRSLTPFVLPRHPKKKIDPETGWLVDGVESQAVRLLGQLPEPIAPPKIDVLDDEDFGGRYRWSAFRRDRLSGKGDRSSRRGYWLKLTFEHPQCGPIAIGYGAHFGLGLFVPIPM